MFGKLRRWMDRLGAQNQALYGAGPLSCCRVHGSHGRVSASRGVVERMKVATERENLVRRSAERLRKP